MTDFLRAKSYPSNVVIFLSKFFFFVMIPLSQFSFFFSCEHINQCLAFVVCEEVRKGLLSIGVEISQLLVNFSPFNTLCLIETFTPITNLPFHHLLIPFYSLKSKY